MNFAASLICPLYGNLDNPISPPLTQKQQFHIKAEAIAPERGEERSGNWSAEQLEPTLRICDACDAKAPHDDIKNRTTNLPERPGLHCTGRVPYSTRAYSNIRSVCY